MKNCHKGVKKNINTFNIRTLRTATLTCHTMIKLIPTAARALPNINKSNYKMCMILSKFINLLKHNLIFFCNNFVVEMFITLVVMYKHQYIY